jgi:LmbE family N-acetylglucosaminyl deacetylase
MVSSVNKALVKQMRNYLRRRLDRQLSQVTAKELAQSALIFSPHPDDETLGCGGTIIRKREAGATIRIVMMTDGSASHVAIMPKKALKKVRKREAIDAAGRLGVVEKNITFLDFPDGRLGRHASAAQRKVAEILERYTDDEVFIPFSGEPLHDHLQTNRIVRNAIQAIGHNRTVYEYPLWAWFAWPLMPYPVRAGIGLQTVFLRNTLTATGGLRTAASMNRAVEVSRVLALKRKALSQHRSQTTRFVDTPRWVTLADISGGDLLSFLCQDYEWFRRGRLPAAR